MIDGGRTLADDAEVAPLGVADAEAAARVAASTIPPSPDVPRESAGERLARLTARVERVRRTDPGGAWVARERGEVAGIALSLRSDGIWVLSLLAVSPAAQSGGLGRRLLASALTHADGCRGALIASSQDPRAIRAYARAGFDLRPAMAASGAVDRTALPAGLDRVVRDGDAGDVELTAPIDAAVRGGTRTAHLAQLLEVSGTRLHLVDGRGYALGRGGRVLVVAATDEEAARALLWRVLADTPDSSGSGALVERIGDGQDWAVDVVLRAGLALRTDGPVFSRGQLGPLRPFLPNGGYL